jgi:hypothetical protein
MYIPPPPATINILRATVEMDAVRSSCKGSVTADFNENMNVKMDTDKVVCIYIVCVRERE